MLGQGMGKGLSASLPSSGALLSQHLLVFTSPEALLSPSSWVFMEISFHRHDWLNHWPLTIDSTSHLSSCWGWDWKFRTPNYMVGSPGNQPPLSTSYSSDRSKQIVTEIHSIILTAVFPKDRMCLKCHLFLVTLNHSTGTSGSKNYISLPIRSW